MRRVVLLLVVLLSSVGWAVAQQRTVTGVVTAADDGSTLPQLSVMIKGTQTGVVTDLDGRYSVRVSGPEAVLVFAYTGYATQEVLVGDRSEINVVMQAELEAIDEVMVVAYGTVKKESFTGSADQISSKKLEKRPVSNVTKGLEGLSSGVMTTSGTGQPGAGSTVVIRGFGSLNASTTPLYVVDGIPYDGAISAINPADIESMTVLKDASAGALYGARGANGVIMITTKKGDASGDDMHVNFRGTWGVASRAIPEYETMDAKEWVEYYYHVFRNEAYAANVKTSELHQRTLEMMTQGPTKIFGSNEMYNPFNYKIADMLDAEGKVREDATVNWTNDWMKEALAKFPFRQEYTLWLTGSSKKTSYMVSFGALDDNGLLRTTRFQRYTGRVNVDAKPKQWLSMGLNSSFSGTKSNYLNAEGTEGSNVFYSAMGMGPIFPVYELDENFNPKLDAKGEKIFDFGGSRPAGSAPKYNCIATLFKDKFASSDDNVSARSYLNFLDLQEGPLQGLKLSLNLGGDYISTIDNTYENRHFGNASGSNGRGSRSTEKKLSYTFNQLLSYVRTFADLHKIDVVAGHESYRLNYTYLYGLKSGFPIDGIYELNAASGGDQVKASASEYRVESWLSRFNYSFADKYYLSASYRRDGSSRFHKDVRWGDFWSVGANWRISNEEFLKGVKWINNLSLRASYGVQGNDDLKSYYPWQAVYVLGYPNAGSSGALINSVENKELKWETNYNANIGIEGRFFNRFGFSIEAYHRHTVDMLMGYPLALSLGFESYNRNIGEMINYGLEFTLSGELVQVNDFRWGLTLMGSTVHNHIKKLADKPEIVDGNRIIREGETIHSYYLPKSAGVDPATGKKLYWAWKVDDNGKKVGDEFITDEPSTATKCRTIVGNRVPDLYGSVSTDFSYFGFDLSVLFTYSIGGKMLDGLYNSLMQPMYPGGAIHKHASRAWKNPGDITDIPKAQLGDDSKTTSDQLIDASYFAIKNISFGYSFPQKWMHAISIEKARLSFVADNIFLLSHLKGMNPQSSIFGGTSYTYVPTRSMSVSLELTF